MEHLERKGSLLVFNQAGYVIIQGAEPDHCSHYISLCFILKCSQLKGIFSSVKSFKWHNDHEPTQVFTNANLQCEIFSYLSINAPDKMIWSAVLPSPVVDTSCRFNNPPEYAGLDNYCLVCWLSWHFYVRLFHEEEN